MVQGPLSHCPSKKSSMKPLSVASGDGSVDALTAGAADGRSNPYLNFRLGSWEATASTARIHFQAPDGQTECGVSLSTAENASIPAGSVDLERSGPSVTAMASGLDAGREYFYAIRCGSASRTGRLRTRVQ